MIKFDEGIEFDEEKILSEIKEKLSGGNIFQKTISYFEIAEKMYKDDANINKGFTINQFYKLVIVEFVKSIDEGEKMIDESIKFLEKEILKTKRHIRVLKNPFYGLVFFFCRKKTISDMENYIEAMENIIKYLNAKTSP